MYLIKGHKRPYENVPLRAPYPRVTDQRTTSSSSYSSTGEASTPDEDSIYSLPTDACVDIVDPPDDLRDRSHSEPTDSTLKANGNDSERMFSVAAAVIFLKLEFFNSIVYFFIIYYLTSAVLDNPHSSVPYLFL